MKQHFNNIAYWLLAWFPRPMAATIISVAVSVLIAVGLLILLALGVFLVNLFGFQGLMGALIIMFMGGCLFWLIYSAVWNSLPLRKSKDEPEAYDPYEQFPHDEILREGGTPHGSMIDNDARRKD